ALPTFDPVGAAGVRQALARLLWLLVAVVREQDVRLCEVSCVLIEDVFGKFPTQHHEAGHLCPRRIGDEQRVIADVERWFLAEVPAPDFDRGQFLAGYPAP